MQTMSSSAKLSEPRPKKRGSYLILLSIVGASLASCGSSTPASTKSTTTTSATSTMSYRSCLAAHGFSFPKYDPSQNNPPTTVAPAVRIAAIAACASSRHHHQTSAAGRRTALRSYLNCLSSHGVTLPTTTTAAIGSSGGPLLRAFGSLRSLKQQPGFAAAAQQCASLKPTFTSNHRPNVSASTTTTG